MRFEKYEGLGNDFVLVEAADEAAVSASAARALCDRRFGVGGDGVLLVLPPIDTARAQARMKVINADGSVPEMCGNGLRCVAAHVARRRGMSRGDLAIETGAGTLVCSVEDDVVTVDMGVVRVLDDLRLDVGGRTFALTLADAGNPHAVTFEPVARDVIDQVGLPLATHVQFTRGTNVEFATVREGAIDLVVWERGVGLTLACGTGACATVAVACAKGLVPFDVPIAVFLPGGALTITSRRADGHAVMRGPARRVFSGEWSSAGG